MNTLSPTAPTVLSLPAKRLTAASIAPNTQKAYAGALRSLEAWLQDREPSDQLLAEYLTQRFEDGAAPASLSLVVSAVKFRCKLQGQSLTAPITQRTLAGIRREGRDRGRGQVKGVNFAQADAAASLASNGGGSLTGLRNAALLAVASDALLRVSEIAALVVEDVTMEEDGTGRLTIRHSKTDQEGEGAVLYLGQPTVERVKAWRKAAGIEDGALFRRVRRGDKTVGEGPLSVVAIRKIIQACARAAGVEGQVSGHSLRVGGAQSLAAGGASVVELQTAGRWQSPSMPGHYARGQLAARGAVARIRYGQ